MRPEKLTVRNIGPFRGTHTINFTELGSIFLVYGKTGAGKTTIFDALSYAFYGEAPGGRKGLSRQMRSQFASDTDESAVELEFTLSGVTYRIRRTLPFDKIGIRSGKINTVAEEVTLEVYSSEGWLNRSSTNKSETDKKILDLIGLSEEEFSRIVLLPQGEFSQFLKQNSSERKEVLSKLFPVKKYSQVTALARERAKIMALRAKETEISILALSTTFNRLAYESDRTAITEEIKNLRAEQTELRLHLGDKMVQLEHSRVIAEKKKQLSTVTRRLDELKNSIGKIDQLKLTLAASRKAEPLAVEYTQLVQLHARTAHLEQELATVTKNHSEKALEINEQEKKVSHIETIKKEKDILHLRKESLRIAVDIAGTLEEEKKTYAQTRIKLASIQKEHFSIKTEEEALITRIGELSNDVARLDLCTQENARAQKDLEKLRQMKILADEYKREKLSINAHTGAITNTSESIREIIRDGEIARAELLSLENEKEKAHSNETAYSLAILLEDGKPCPVCGSHSHPTPAITGLKEFSFTERIDALKRRIEQLTTKGESLGKILAGREADLRNAEETLASIITKYCTTGDANNTGACISPQNILTPEEATSRLREASIVMQETANSLSRSQKAFRESEEIRRKQEEITKRLTRVVNETAEIKAVAVEQKALIEHKQNRFNEAFPQNSESVETGFSEPSDAADALDQCSARILVIEADINTHESKLTDAHIQRSALEGKKNEIQRSFSILKEQSTEAAIHFEKKCIESGFADGDAVRKAERSREEREQTEKEIIFFGEELAATKTRTAQLETELAASSGSETETVATEIEALDARIALTNRKVEDRTSALSNLDSLKTQWDDLEKERSSRSCESGRLTSLANDLTGINSLKTSFDAWILGMYLEEITAYANTRLERMSEGRYRIQLNDSYRKGNSLSGLDLEIRDAYTGKTRPSGTLSGGETFMASISLALGLADSIQSRAGGIQLDAVFIDEGFGSLDESSLERAITILDEIRGKRMVGLISHVAELRTRIPNRIEIVKTGAGSTIQKETYND